MSDFTNNFWSVYIAAVTLVGIIACMLLLVITARGGKKAAPAKDNTTGHVWDEDLRELNNPMPAWWMGLFVITAVFGLGYLLLYPGLGAFGGKLQWTQASAHAQEMARAQAALEPLYARFAAMGAEEMARDSQAMAIGERLFMNNCAQCHGSDARGSKGFPDLTDNDWLAGGAPEQIKTTITEGRTGIMAPIAAAVGTPEDVRNVAHYVLSLSASPHDALRASLGQAKFAVCAACHGADGKGNPLLGAPNLTDEMPAQKDKLTEAQINVLTAYVWGLSNKTAAGD